jgi:prophage regulatory protein
LDRIIRLPELLRITGLSTASVYRQMAETRFPRPVRLGKNAVGWRASAVLSWLESLEEAE